MIHDTAPPNTFFLWPHSVNATKYLFALIMTLSQGLSLTSFLLLRKISFLTRISFPTVMVKLNDGFSSYCSCQIVGLVALTLFTTMWDIIMDWGLLRPAPSSDSTTGHQYWRLREKLMFLNPWYYYAAMPLNFILRGAWVLSVLPSSSLSFTKNSTYSMIDIIFPFLAILEQAR